jgi:hypothetical protein
MEELYAEGLATHGGPESCVDHPRGRGEALTGARAGRAMEPRNGNPGCPRCLNSGRQHCRRRYARVAGGPRAVGEPGHVRNLHARNRESPCPPAWLTLHTRKSLKAAPVTHITGTRATSPRLTIPHMLSKLAGARG